MVNSDLSNEEIDSLLKDLDNTAGEDKGLAMTEEPVNEDINLKEAVSDSPLSPENLIDLGKDTLEGSQTKVEEKEVKKVRFSELSSDGEDLVPSNLKMLLEVPMDITVELGRTVRKIKDILSLNVGAVVELNKLSGEPVELLVNGKIIALGEVVIIDENFGVRIIEILNPENRIKFE